jgi:hypothetical protein
MRTVTYHFPPFRQKTPEGWALATSRLFREFGDGLRIDVKAIVGSFGEASSRAQEVPLPPNKEYRWNENHRWGRHAVTPLPKSHSLNGTYLRLSHQKSDGAV